jgi:hypothetical protein
VLRAIYLSRRDGAAAHPDLAAMVDGSRGQAAYAHAEQLVAAGRTQRSSGDSGVD